MPPLGPSLPLSPPPCLLPLVGDGPVCLWLTLLWNCSVFLLFLSNAARSSPFSPHLLVAEVSTWGTFLLGVAFRHVICGFYLFFLPVRLPSEIRKLPPDLPVRGFPGVWKLPLLLMTPFPGRVSIPSSFVSIFIFYILSYLLLKTVGCFSGRLMSSASDQKLFFTVCSVFKCSFDEFLGEKVVSMSYSSAILALPSRIFNFMLKLANEKYKYAGYPLDSKFLKAATLESIIKPFSIIFTIVNVQYIIE